MTGGLPALWVHDAVLARLAVVPARPWEIGGWLLGFWAPDERSVFVTHVTPPASRGTPFGVRISGRGHSERFEEAWTASGGHVTFLGDWHTHPGCPALPSERDRTALEQLSADPAFGTARPLAAIVRTPRWPFSDEPTEIRWHVLLDDSDGPHELRARVADTLPNTAAAVPEWPWRSCCDGRCVSLAGLRVLPTVGSSIGL